MSYAPQQLDRGRPRDLGGLIFVKCRPARTLGGVQAPLRSQSICHFIKIDCLTTGKWVKDADVSIFRKGANVIRVHYSLRFSILLILLGWLSVCGVSQATGQLGFEAVKVPETDLEKRRILSAPSVSLSSKDPQVPARRYAIGYHSILRSAEASLQGGPFGMLVDVHGAPVPGDDGSPRISSDNDFSSLLQNEDGQLFMVSHFESRPGGIYLTRLTQDQVTGRLAPVETRPIDLSGVRGGWVHCAGSVTPWNAHLGGEEYEPDARLLQLDGSMPESSYYEAMAVYYPEKGLAAMHPYDFGWSIEIKVDSFEDVSVTKHYAMGRLSLELAYVLPDRRTAYLSDDGTGVGFFMFIADHPGDLSAGHLYAAQWAQLSDRGAGRARLDWHALGHATSAEIEKYIEARVSFGDLFETAEPLEGECPEGFVSTNHGHDTGQPYPGRECLKVKPGMEKAASRLEARRYAALLGATTEFRKMEGMTFDPNQKRLYLAMSEISQGMEDFARNGEPTTQYDEGGPNHIHLRYNLCGAVYGLKLAGDRLDSTGNPIDSDYVALNMVSWLEGRMTRAWDETSEFSAYAEDGPFAANRCDLNGIANPDNLSIIPAYRTLIIGEDSGEGHQNDAVWAYDLTTKNLTRIQTTPYGSETTSVYVYPNINGWGYLMSVVQHPYEESDSDQYRIGSLADRAYTGYVGPFPALD